jgi:hypothetical protein
MCLKSSHLQTDALFTEDWVASGRSNLHRSRLLLIFPISVSRFNLLSIRVLLLFYRLLMFCFAPAGSHG